MLPFKGNSMTIGEGSCIKHSHGIETRRNVELDGPKAFERVWVGYFLSHGTPKIPSSINEPVPGSKILGKWSEKKREMSNHG